MLRATLILLRSSKFIKPALSNEHPFIKSSIAEDDKVMVRESVTSALARALKRALFVASTFLAAIAAAAPIAAAAAAAALAALAR